MEITKELNDIAMRSFSIVLDELFVSTESIRKFCAHAVQSGDAQTVAVYAMTILQCEFAMRILAMRVACYRRCVEDEAASAKFWSMVVFN